VGLHGRRQDGPASETVTGLSSPVETSRFTDEAVAYVHRIGVKKKIVLIDGAKLADLLIDRDVGVVAAHTYVVKKIDSDFFLDAG